MKVSVVVPAFNEEKLLARSLAAIRGAMAAFTQFGWDAELIVCDNNSTDATAAIARAAGAKVVFEPVNQISRARNAGAAAATGDWLLFVDADSFPSPDLFRDVREIISSKDILAGGATVAFPDASPLGARLAIGLWNTVSRAGRWAAGSFIFCDSAAFREIGGFSPELYASEELDLFRRLKRLARRTGRRVVILHGHPLLTSDRKLALYGWGPFLRVMARTVLTAGASLRRREDLGPWYDGRR